MKVTNMVSLTRTLSSTSVLKQQLHLRKLFHVNMMPYIQKVASIIQMMIWLKQQQVNAALLMDYSKSQMYISS